MLNAESVEKIKAGKFITRTAFEYNQITGLDIVFVDKDNNEKTVAMEVDPEFAHYFVALANQSGK